MKFWKRLREAKQNHECEASLPARHPETVAALREKALEHQTPIGVECMDRVISGGAVPDETRAGWVAMLAMYPT